MIGEEPADQFMTDYDTDGDKQISSSEFVSGNIIPVWHNAQTLPAPRHQHRSAVSWNTCDNLVISRCLDTIDKCETRERSTEQSELTEIETAKNCLPALLR